MRTQSSVAFRDELVSVAGLHDEEFFNNLLQVEIRRTERSGRPFLLMLINLTHVDREEKDKTVSKIASTLLSLIRETDVSGWYEKPSAIGTIFTEFNHDSDMSRFRGVIFGKVCGGIRSVIGPRRFDELEIRFLAFPHDPLNEIHPGIDSNKTNHHPLVPKLAEKRRPLAFKRLLDVLGSSAAILLALPLLLAIAAAIKLSSPGPVLFRQERVGQLQKRFMFLKFRSMYVNSDPTVHQKFMKKYMEGGGADHCTGSKDERTYKITKDPRVTPIGKWLRKTSLDELPQFFNVLKGEMSLVGPRPPIPYESECYDLWHRRRVNEAKPGITGLWQVNGRSSLPFDDAVRLDIKYIREWSLWLDFKILLQTPWVVLTCKGGY